MWNLRMVIKWMKQPEKEHILHMYVQCYINAKKQTHKTENGKQKGSNRHSPPSDFPSHNHDWNRDWTRKTSNKLANSEWVNHLTGSYSFVQKLPSFVLYKQFCNCNILFQFISFFCAAYLRGFPPLNFSEQKEMMIVTYNSKMKWNCVNR